jgi:hypothetical protein
VSQRNKINVGEETDPGMTAAALAAFGPRPKLLAVASSAVPSRSPSSVAATAPALEESAAPLFSPEEAKEFRARWDAIQVGFVDDPRHAVGQANALVDATLTRLAAMFASQRPN